MSKILVFTNEKNTKIASVLKAINNNYDINERSFSETVTDEDFSDVECVVLNLKQEDMSLDLNNIDNKLVKFFENNNIDSKIPIMPILYDAKLVDQVNATNDLENFIAAHKALDLNFLVKGLIWFETEPLDAFKDKIEKASYETRYPEPSLYRNKKDWEVDNKSAGISYAITIALGILLGIILGPVIGGLIGGLAIGGLVSGFVGVGIGLIAGPVAGYILTQFVGANLSKGNVALEKERTIDLQKQRTFYEGHNLWSVFKYNFLPSSSSSPLSKLSNKNDESRQPLNEEQELSSDELGIGYASRNKNEVAKNKDIENSQSASATPKM